MQIMGLEWQLEVIIARYEALDAIEDPCGYFCKRATLGPFGVIGISINTYFHPFGRLSLDIVRIYILRDLVNR